MSAAGVSPDLVLDPKIRDWVLIPILLVTVFLGILRHYVQLLLKSDGNTADPEKLRLMNTLQRSQRIRASASFIPPSAYFMRRQHFVEDDTGVLAEKDLPGATNPMADPNGGMDMMKGQMANTVPHIVMMTAMNYLFSGFVISKVPFPLTPRFKMMLQQGVSLSTLDSSYVSALSWYFIIMFGIRGFTSLVLGGSVAYSDMHAMQMQAQMGQTGNNPQFDAGAAFKAEKRELEVIKHTWHAADAELRLLGAM